MTPATQPAERPHASVLVVEDDPSIRSILTRFLEGRGHAVQSAEHGLEALEVLATNPIDLVLSDVRMPQMSGLDLVRVVRERDPDIQLILITGHSSVRDAVEAIKLGAADYVEKPIDPHRLGRIVDSVLEKRDLQQRTRILEQRLQGTVAFRGMIARSQVMLEAFSFIERLARYPTTVLITGESGTGKELVARALHDLSPVRDRPFVACNCTTLAPTLLESELFGYVRGAFTGADRDRKGLFEAAEGGTIFLDEIGELPLGTQVKLLRVLENREIKRVGSPTSVTIDIRVVAATNLPLTDMVANGTFRADLYYRLNVGAVHLPPLRERPEDIEALVRHFIEQHNRRLGCAVTSISPRTLQLLQAYPWPGNVREVANVVERAMVVAHGSVLLPEHLPPEVFDRGHRLPTGPATPADLSLEAAEREQILRALQASGGKRVEAARLLGLSRRTLYRKLERYGIT
jgi:DNA-binding NtrC family response regulator